MTQGTPVSLVTTVPGEGRLLGLTFDDGPHPVHTPRLLDVLAAHRVRAVFLLWGEHVREHPDVVRRIAAEGHVLGNHSLRHDDLGSWGPEAVAADLVETTALVREAVPGAPVPWFRAPYGSWGVTPEVAAGLGMRSLGWEVVVEDWEEPGADVLLERLRERLTERAVVLLHDAGGDRSGTVEAVERWLPEVAAAGWRTTLPDPT